MRENLDIWYGSTNESWENTIVSVVVVEEEEEEEDDEEDEDDEEEEEEAGEEEKKEVEVTSIFLIFSEAPRKWSIHWFDRQWVRLAHTMTPCDNGSYNCTNSPGGSLISAIVGNDDSNTI